MKTKARDIIAGNVVEQILDAVKAGGLFPWQRPWVRRSYVNMASKHVFQGGFNCLLLNLFGEGEYRFATFKQIRAAKGLLKKGSKAINLLQPTLVPKKDKDGKPVLRADGKPVYICVSWSYYGVFKAADVEGGKFAIAAVSEIADFETKAEFSAIIEALGVPVKEDGGTRAFYRPATHTVSTPKKTDFKSEVGYYQTLMHEIAHWSGVECGQVGKGKDQFEEKNYAQEELVAEITANIVLSVCGVAPQTDQSAAYVTTWMKRLSDDPSCLVTAANAAQRRADWILNGGKFAEKKEENAA